MIADIVFSFYLGASQTRPSDLHVTQAARGNDATVRSVLWRGYPFRFEIYYGWRFTLSDRRWPQTQIALDFTHFKIYAETSKVVAQDGVWHGARFAQTAPMNDRVQSFELTHGANMLGISVLERVTDRSGSGGVYVGGGPVIYLPHSESRVDGIPGGDGYEYGGGGFQVVAGATGCIRNSRVFAEGKYSHGAPIVTIAGGHAQTRVDTVHELAGVTFGHCSQQLRTR